MKGSTEQNKFPEIASRNIAFFKAVNPTNNELCGVAENCHGGI